MWGLCKGLCGIVLSAFRGLKGGGGARKSSTHGRVGEAGEAVPVPAPAPAPTDAIDALVEAYVKNRLIDLPLIPNFIERRIYRGVLKMGLDALLGGGGDGPEGCIGSAVVMGHMVRAHLSPSLAADAVRKRRAEKTAEELATQRGVIDRMIARFARRRILDVRFVPDFVQETMYANVIEIVVGLLQDTLECARATVLGHELSFRFVPIAAHVEEGSGGSPAAPAASPPESREVIELRGRLVERKVEAYMEENNRFFIPDGIERALYSAGLNVFLCVMDDLLRESRLRLLDHCVTLTVTPLAPPGASDLPPAAPA